MLSDIKISNSEGERKTFSFYLDNAFEYKAFNFFVNGAGLRSDVEEVKDFVNFKNTSNFMTKQQTGWMNTKRGLCENY